MTARTRGWTAQVESQLLTPFEPGVVLYRTVLYPATGTATWTRDDGLVVELSLRVDPDRGGQVTKVTIAAPDGSALATDATRLPIITMGQRSIETLAFRRAGETDPVQVGPPGRIRTDRGRLEHVARLYDEAVVAGEPVATHVGQGLDVTVGRRQAEALIAMARKEGLLEPSPPGRKPKPKGEPDGTRPHR